MPSTTSNAHETAVLIVSDDAAFSRAITSRWQSERNLPSFTVVGSDLCSQRLDQNFQAAIVGAIEPRRLSKVVQTLQASSKPVVLIGERSANPYIHESYPRLLVVQPGEAWLDTVVLLTGEILRRCEVANRACRLEQESALLQRDAMLGRYILEMRHTMNNALTAVLGNAELLLLEPGTLSAGTLSQVETVRNMGLRIHEIMQRFTSLEKEFSVVERQAEKDGQSMARAAGAHL
jgi:signal transduction histidine kinase